jgi:hypothetical protein
MARGRCVTLATVAVLLCCSCGLPSQPVRQSVGLAQVSGTVVVLLPACADVQVESVIFAPDDGASPLDESRWWTASGYITPSTGGTSGASAPRIVLDPAYWESSSGPVPDWTRPFSVDVVTAGELYAGVADEEDIPALRALGGEFLVDGAVMGEREFLEADGPSDCPASSSGEALR